MRKVADELYHSWDVLESSKVSNFFKDLSHLSHESNEKLNVGSFSGSSGCLV